MSEKIGQLKMMAKDGKMRLTLAEMNEEERENRRIIDGSYSAFERFAEWYEK